MASMEVVGTKCMFMAGDIVNIKYWVGVVKCSEGQRLVELCCLIYRESTYNKVEH